MHWLQQGSSIFSTASPNMYIGHAGMLEDLHDMLQKDPDAQVVANCMSVLLEVCSRSAQPSGMHAKQLTAIDIANAVSFCCADQMMSSHCQIINVNSSMSNHCSCSADWFWAEPCHKSSRHCIAESDQGKSCAYSVHNKWQVQELPYPSDATDPAVTL